MMDEPSEDILGCGDISEDKANWLLEQAGDLIPEDPEQITLSQYEHQSPQCDSRSAPGK